MPCSIFDIQQQTCDLYVLDSLGGYLLPSVWSRPQFCWLVFQAEWMRAGPNWNEIWPDLKAQKAGAVSDGRTKRSQRSTLTRRQGRARAVTIAAGPLCHVRGSWGDFGMRFKLKHIAITSHHRSPFSSPLYCASARQCGYVGTCQSVGVWER